MIKLTYNVKFFSKSPYNDLLNYELTQKCKFKNFDYFLKFRITKYDFEELYFNDGSGRCYAYLLDFNKLCEIKVYKFYVVNFFVVSDEDFEKVYNNFLS